MKVADELIETLEQLVRVYRSLLDVVRRENHILIKADLSAIAELNISKEKLVLKVRSLDNQWQQSAKALASQLKIEMPTPSLLVLVKNIEEGERAKKLQQIRSVLNIIVSRILELNKKNEHLVQVALAHIGGAMESITQTLNENPTYGQGGFMEEENKDAQGRLMSREV